MAGGSHTPGSGKNFTPCDYHSSALSKRFNEGPIKNGGRRVIFVSGDHSEPNDFVVSVIESFGFAPIYLGGLATGGRLQQAGGPFAGRDLVDFGSH